MCNLTPQSEFISTEKLSDARIYPPLPRETVGVCLSLPNEADNTVLPSSIRPFSILNSAGVWKDLPLLLKV